MRYASKLKALYELTDADGRTVRGIAAYDREALIVFTDGTFLRMVARVGYEEDVSIDYGGEFVTDFRHDELVRIGYMTKEEIDEAEAREGARYEKMESERERAEYERLRKKFGG